MTNLQTTNYIVKKMGDEHLKFHVISLRGDAEMGTWSIAQCWSEKNAQHIADLFNKEEANA